MQETLDQIIIFAISFIANLFASVSGGGAGFIQFPVLILMGLPFAQALGTHKIAVVFLGLGAIIKKKRKEGKFNLDKRLSYLLLLVGCPSVVLGTYIVLQVPAHIAEIFVGLITVASGIYTFYKKEFGVKHDFVMTKTRLAIGIILIILIGMFSGSLSSGSGLFGTMCFVMVFGLDLKSAILHTMLFIGTIWNAVGAITVSQVVSIYWPWVPTMVIATFLGSYLGASLLYKLNVNSIRIIFSCVSLLSGFILIGKAIM